MRRPLVLVLAGALLLLAAGLVALRFLLAPEPGAVTAQDGPVPIGGPFTLTDQTGRRVTEQDFRGRYMLLYFGYTHCPDMCPLGLQTMAQAMDALPAGLQERVVPVFMTVDPARDTVETLKGYVELFHPRLVGLTGSEAEVADALKAFRVYARKAEGGTDEGYLVDHSTFTYLMDPDGAYVTHFGHGTTPESMAERLSGIVGQG